MIDTSHTAIYDGHKALNCEGEIARDPGNSRWQPYAYDKTP